MNGLSRLIVVTFVLCSALATMAFAQETNNEIWPEVDVYVKLSKAGRLYFTAKPVISEDDGSLSESQYGANFEMSFAPIHHVHIVRPRDPDALRHTRFRVGYWAARTNEVDGSRVSERRVLTGFTARTMLGWNVLGSLRNRVEFRWLDGGYTWRYRPRLKLRRNFQIGSFEFDPYISAELFYDARYYDWSRTRYEFGLVFPVTDWFVPEIYYSRQNDREPANKSVNAIGPKITFHF